MEQFLLALYGAFDHKGKKSVFEGVRVGYKDVFLCTLFSWVSIIPLLDSFDFFLDFIDAPHFRV